jgi:hypothetical protein
MVTKVVKAVLLYHFNVVPLAHVPVRLVGVAEHIVAFGDTLVGIAGLGFTVINLETEVLLQVVVLFWQVA